MQQDGIIVENYLPLNFKSYLKETVSRSLASKVMHIPTKFLYTERGSKLFQKFTELNNNHSSQLEKEVIGNFSEFDVALQTSNILVELGAGSFERTLNIVSKVKANKEYHFWAVDFSIEPALTTIKKLHYLNNKCICKLILADYELPLLNSLIGPQIENVNILWLGNSCVNIFPEMLESIFKELKARNGIDRTLSIGINLSRPSSQLCEELLYSDKQGFFAEFRKSSLQLLEEELDLNIPWHSLSWKTYYREDINAYVSVFSSDQDWTLTIGAKNSFEIRKYTEVVVGYSHTYTLNELNVIIKNSGWHIHKMSKDERTGYAILILKSLPI